MPNMYKLFEKGSRVALKRAPAAQGGAVREQGTVPRERQEGVLEEYEGASRASKCEYNRHELVSVNKGIYLSTNHIKMEFQYHVTAPQICFLLVLKSL